MCVCFRVRPGLSFLLQIFRVVGFWGFGVQGV